MESLLQGGMGDVPMLIGVLVLVVVVAVVVRVLSNIFHGNRPPVDEGIPFVGGLMKFSKVGWVCLCMYVCFPGMCLSLGTLSPSIHFWMYLC